MRVLLVKTSSMGDVIHTLPALSDARQMLEQVQVDWVVEENFAQIPRWHPAVDRVITVAIRRWRKAWFSATVRNERRVFRQAIQTRHYDAVIDAQGLLKSAALIARYAYGVKHGMDWHSAREPLAGLFYQRRHFIARQQHAVERSRQLLAHSLGYTLPASRGDYAIASRFLLPAGTESAGYLVFLHATSREEKHWPVQHWRELISRAEQAGWRVKLPWGNDMEHQRAQAMAAGFRHAEVLPHLSLEQIAQLLAAASAVVSVDTGLSHLAAALGRPNVTLYGPTDPCLIGGYGDNQHALLSATGNMADITVPQVDQVLMNIAG